MHQLKNQVSELSECRLYFNGLTSVQSQVRYVEWTTDL